MTMMAALVRFKIGGAHLGFACLLLVPNAECNVTLLLARHNATHKHAPVQTAFKARVQEKNELEILC
jgi:hypothetical protein